jgi:hypothetical protein
MPRRLIPSVLLALACLLALGVSAPIAGALTRDAQTRQNVRLIKTYVDAYAGAHGFTFPAPSVVRKGGGLTAPVWPVNPFTGKPMAPGAARGAYTYVLATEGDGYTLTGRLSSGSFAVTGGTPVWLADERAAAASALQGARDATAAAQAQMAAAQQQRDAALADAAAAQTARDAALGQLATVQAQLATAQGQLTTAQSQLAAKQSELDAANDALLAARADLASARADLTTMKALRDAALAELAKALDARDAALAQLVPAKDTAARSGLAMIQEVLRNLAQGMGALPAKENLTFSAAGSSWPAWPYSPFDGQRMSQGSAPGQFTYTPGADGSWTLIAHLTSGDYTLTQGAFDWAARKDQLTILGATFISYGLEVDAIMNNDTYPWSLSQATLSTVDPWPFNQFTGQAMKDGSGRGDFDYSVTATGYSLVANLTDGSTYDVDAWTQPIFAPLWRLRVSLKDMALQGYAQILKDYVDQWKSEHGGALPTVEQMDPTGAVGSTHTWWPKNPWTLAPMTGGTSLGCYEYVPGAQGAFTVTVHQSPLPMVNGQAGTEFPPTYTAQ